MKLPLLLAIAAPLAAAADAADVEFLTALVTDFKALPRSYFDFLATANPPPELTSLALQVQTYTDDLYTTLLDANNVNVGELRSFASKLPWALRLDQQGGAGAADNSAQATTTDQTTDQTTAETTSEATSDNTQATTDKNTKKTKDNTKETNAGGGAAKTTKTKTTKTKGDKNPNTGLTLVFNDIDGYLQSRNLENSRNIAGSFVAPVGAVLGAVAMVLL